MKRGLLLLSLACLFNPLTLSAGQYRERISGANAVSGIEGEQEARSYVEAREAVVSRPELVARDVEPCEPEHWWSGSVDLGDGWRWLPWFGYFNVNADPWIYHNELQWMYGIGTEPASIVFYSLLMSGTWLWTSDAMFPYLYRIHDSSWLWYQQGSSYPSWFYNLTEEWWESWPMDTGEMVFVPEGEFTMGSDSGESNEQPVHAVYLDAFWIDRTEVTVAAYRQCRAVGGCTSPHFANCNWLREGREQHPVNCVDWHDAEDFCAWAGKRLPTEAEWEKAARGTDARTYPWGEAAPTCSYAVMDDPDAGGSGCGLDLTWPVGSKPSGASPFGALDMAGNVSEWVHDWYASKYYSLSPYTNPTGPGTGTYKIRRGGNWMSDAWFTRTSKRIFQDFPGYDYSREGFRCARNAE